MDHIFKLCAPGTIHSVDSKKSDPQMEFVLRQEQFMFRKTTLKWKYVVCLEQFIFDSVKNDPQVEYFGAPETVRA